MAEEGGSGSWANKLFETIEDLIINKWHWLLLAGFLYFVWQYNYVKIALDLVATIFLGWAAWKLWVHYVQQDFISGIDFVLLEIVPPREVLRSPAAMELFFTNALYHFSNKGGKESYWQGAVWFWFSLEIASIDGQVHFYIRTPTRVRGLIETQMYAQFPQAQVKAVEDYTLAVDEVTPKSDWMGWGCELKLNKPEAFPIKTYVDFGLDEDPKEEYKVDPISPIIEFFGSIKKGEQMWMQIVVTPSKVEYKDKGSFFGTHNWGVEARLQMQHFLDPYTRVYPGSGENGADAREVRAPGFLDSVVKGMSAKTSKLGFDTGIRIMYVAKKEVYNLESRRNVRLIWRQFEKPDCNGFTRTNNTQGDAFNSQFYGLSQEKTMILVNRCLEEYRERQFFHPPLRHILSDHNITGPILVLFKQFFLPYFHSPTFVLNTEELATLWHFPGQILKVPTLERIESKEAAPPTNLPT